jgi:hypothetical protein
MLVWRKLSSEKWADSWQERLAFLGAERLVITQIASSRRIRLEIFDITTDESSAIETIPGEVRRPCHSTDWCSIVLSGRISIRDGCGSQRQTEFDRFKRPKAIHTPADLAGTPPRHDGWVPSAVRRPPKKGGNSLMRARKRHSGDPAARLGAKGCSADSRAPSPSGGESKCSLNQVAGEIVSCGCPQVSTRGQL